MNIPHGDYDLREFCKEIIRSPERTLEGFHYNQIKSYFYLTQSDYSLRFPDRYEVEDFGEMTKVTTTYVNRKGSEEPAVFFVGPYGEENGLIAILTAETEEAIQQVLLPTLNSRDDISPMPILTEDFQRMNDIILGKHENMRVTEFKSQRIPDLADAKVRPEVNRSIEYKGRDGRPAIEEFRDLYGVVPVRVQYEHQNISLKIDTTGKFTLKKVNRENFNLLFELIEETVQNVLNIRDITQQIRFKKEEVPSGNLSITVPKIEAGEVTFERELNRLVAEDFVEGTRQSDRVDFSFTDIAMEAGSLDFSAQVTDERRGSFFNISATSDKMKIVPQRNCSFPSLVEFYLCILQNIDAGADIHLHEVDFAA